MASGCAFVTCSLLAKGGLSTAVTSQESLAEPKMSCERFLVFVTTTRLGALRFARENEGLGIPDQSLT